MPLATAPSAPTAPAPPPRPRRGRTLALALGLGLGLVAAASGVGCAFGAPRYDGRVSDHFDGRRFFNPHATPPHGPRGLLKWMTQRNRGPWSAPTETAPGQPPPRRVEGGAVRVTFVGHSTLLVQMDGLNLLTDPIWSERASPVTFAGPRRVRPPGVRFEDLPPIDVVLVSHNHYDHLDLRTLRRLAAEHRPRFVVPLGNAAVLARAGLPGAVELDWWQDAPLAPGVRVVAAPAQHFSNRGPFDAGNTLWASFVIEGPSGRVFFGGDTGYGAHFREIAGRLGAPRVAILPIGAFRPRWFMESVHMSPQEAVAAARELGAGTSVAMHFGTFPLADDGEGEPVEELGRAVQDAPGIRFWVLGFGEGRDVPPGE